MVKGKSSVVWVDSATMAPCYAMGRPVSMPSYFIGKRGQNSCRLSKNSISDAFIYHFPETLYIVSDLFVSC